MNDEQIRKVLEAATNSAHEVERALPAARLADGPSVEWWETFLESLQENLETVDVE